MTHFKYIYSNNKKIDKISEIIKFFIDFVNEKDFFFTQSE